MESTIAQPLTFKCGLEVKNRLVKSAMAEKMADQNGAPTEALERLYREWGSGGWGMILTGNVQVDNEHLISPGDVTFNVESKDELIRRWKSWAAACTSQGTPTIMQINHPGRQSPRGAGLRGVFAQPIAPSPVPINLGSGLMGKIASFISFASPREMTQSDIDKVIKQFADTSRMAAEAGFQGVQIHAAHGYLLAQFLSARTNHRIDAYGKSPVGRAKIIVEIIQTIRRVVSDPRFCVGIKLNSVDHQSVDEMGECIEQLEEILEASVDFVEVSGGSYEDMTMLQDTPSQPSSSSTHREAFFLEFASVIRREFPNVPLMVTGGFRTRKGMVHAVDGRGCDLVGLARPAVLNPTLPNDVVFNPGVSGENSRLVTRKVAASWVAALTGIKFLGSGAEVAWYTQQIQNIANSS